MAGTADDLTPATAPRRGADDLVPRRGDGGDGWLLPAVRGFLRAVSWVWRRPHTPRLADAYAVGWVAVLVVVLVVSDWSGWVVVVAGYRYVDLVDHHALALLRDPGVAPGDPRRSLLVAGVNLVEFAFVVGSFFRWQRGGPVGAALQSGFDAVTLRGSTSHPETWLDVATVGGTAAALLLFVAVVAAVVELRK